jgi:DNA-binding Xre family transcriptional regulator
VSRFCNIFDQTLKRYRIKAVELSERAGVSSALISDFRNDRKATTTDTLERLLEAMEELAPGSKDYFYYQLTGSKNLVELVSNVPDEQLAVLIDIVADRLRSGGNINRTQETLIGA